MMCERRALYTVILSEMYCLKRKLHNWWMAEWDHESIMKFKFWCIYDCLEKEPSQCCMFLYIFHIASKVVNHILIKKLAFSVTKAITRILRTHILYINLQDFCFSLVFVSSVCWFLLSWLCSRLKINCSLRYAVT